MDEILQIFGGADKIWGYIKMFAVKGGREATRTMLELFYVLKSPSTNTLDKALIVAALGYQLLPEDALPRDRYGILGFLDNGVTLAFAYSRVKSSVTPEIESHVEAVLDQWFGPAQQKLSGDNVENNDILGGPVYQPVPTVNTNGTNNNIPPCQQPIRPQQGSWDEDEDVIID